LLLLLVLVDCLVDILLGFGLIFAGLLLFIVAALGSGLISSKNSNEKQKILEPAYEKCFDCDKKLLTSVDQVEVEKSDSFGNQGIVKLCRECITKEFDKQDGVCPQCKKPLKWNGNLREFFGEWYHPKCAFEIQQGKSTKEVKEVMQEVIVKVRCHYCKYPYDESLGKCPQCGAKN
jgi:hypothetical protein